MWLEILLLLSSLFLYLYWYVTKHFGYFKARGVAEATPTFPFGSNHMWKLMMRKASMLNFLDDLTRDFPDDKMVGVYAFGQRTLVVKDVELAKHVLIKDADHFTDRRVIDLGDAKTESNQIFNMMLTQLKGDKWKQIRTIVSPIFTSGKLRKMVHHVDKCSRNLEEFFSNAARMGETLEAKDIYGKLALDAIATSGFGIESNSMKDPDNVFRITALKLIRAEPYVSKLFFIKMFIMLMAPKLAGSLGWSMFPDGTAEFFAKIIRQTLEERRKSGARRNDIIDLLVDELKDQGKVANSEEAETEFEKDAAIDVTSIGSKAEIDMEIALISNAMIFFFAGFDTTSTTLAATIFALLKNPQYQERVREEIEEVVGDSQDIKFEQLQDLKYTENFLYEASRFYGLVNMLERVCTKDYRVPGTDFVIPEGMIVQVNSKSFRTACFYNAEEFDPDNFDPNNNPNKFGFTGFGQGPRNCIGMRYAMVTMKLALVHTLRKFRVVNCDQTVDELTFDAIKNYFNGGVKFKVEEIISSEE